MLTKVRPSAEKSRAARKTQQRAALSVEPLEGRTLLAAVTLLSGSPAGTAAFAWHLEGDPPLDESGSFALNIVSDNDVQTIYERTLVSTTLSQDTPLWGTIPVVEMSSSLLKGVSFQNSHEAVFRARVLSDGMSFLESESARAHIYTDPTLTFAITKTETYEEDGMPIDIHIAMDAVLGASQFGGDGAGVSLNFHVGYAVYYYTIDEFGQTVRVNLAYEDFAGPASVLTGGGLFDRIQRESHVHAQIGDYVELTVDLDGQVSTAATRRSQIDAAVDYDWSLTNPNSAPEVTVGPSSPVPYTAGAAPVAIAPDITVTDSDSQNFKNGTISVDLLNATPFDVLAIANQGNGPDQVGVSGTTVSYGGAPIGTITSAPGAEMLTVEFNSSANADSVQAVLRQVTFATTSTSAPDNDRSIFIEVTDGDGGTSLPNGTRVDVTSLPATPGIQFSGVIATHTIGGNPTLIAPQATVTGLGQLPSLSGGKLAVRITGGSTKDVLTIQNQGTGPGPISISGKNVLFGNIVMGTFKAGSGKKPFSVKANSRATPESVQALVRSLVFKADARSSSVARRTLNFEVSMPGIGSLGGSTWIDVVAATAS